MPVLSHANTTAMVVVVLTIVVVVAVVVLAIVVAVVILVAVVEVLLVALVFRAYGRGLQDKTAQRLVEYLMGRRDLKAC